MSSITILPEDTSSGILHINGMLAGKNKKFQCRIKDCEELRLIVANLLNLKCQNFTGSISIKFSDIHKVHLHKSIWMELTDALFAFTLRTDLLKLGI